MCMFNHPWSSSWPQRALAGDGVEKQWVGWRKIFFHFFVESCRKGCGQGRRFPPETRHAPPRPPTPLLPTPRPSSPHPHPLPYLHPHPHPHPLKKWDSFALLLQRFEMLTHGDPPRNFQSLKFQNTKISKCQVPRPLSGGSKYRQGVNTPPHPVC